MSMRNYLAILGAAVLAAPLTALAVTPASAESSPAQMCKQERQTMGEAAFKLLHGTNENKSNAFGKCVSKKAKQGQAARTNASARCRAEQSDPNFAATHGGKTFDQFYGTNKKGSNAFGKCVSTKASETVAASHNAVLNAAKRCKAERNANPTAFKNTHGTNKNKSNALGKCISKLVKA
jgi:hypothetical protein